MILSGKSVARLCALALGAVLFVGLMNPTVAAEKHHRLAIHVDENDAKRMNLVLNNAKNVHNYYKSVGATVEIEIVAYGPGLHMLRSDTSPVKGRISAMSMEYDNISFAACGNTINGMSKKEGKKVPIMEEAKHVQAGVVRLMELQEAGWSYIRP